MDTTKGLFTQQNEVRNSIRRMKYLELAFYPNSVYISGKPLYAEPGDRTTKYNSGMHCRICRELTNLETLFLFALQKYE